MVFAIHNYAKQKQIDHIPLKKKTNALFELMWKKQMKSEIARKMMQLNEIGADR